MSSVLERLSPVSILNIHETIGTLLEELCHPAIVLECLRANDRQEAGRKHVHDNIHHPGSMEGHTLLFLKWSARVY